MSEKTITITLCFGAVSWSKTYKDGEIGDGTGYTIREWYAMPHDERMLNALVWCGAVLTSEVDEALAKAEGKTGEGG